MYPKKHKHQVKSETKKYSPKESEIKRLGLIEKISQFLSIKHAKLFQDSKYDKVTLKNDLNGYLTEKVLSNFEFQKFISFVENEIFTKIYKNENNKKLELDLLSKSNPDLKNIGSTNQLLSELDQQQSYKTLENEERSLISNHNGNHHLSHLNSPVHLQYSNESSNNTIEYNILYDKKEKLEILKNIREKDDWAALAKKDYQKFLEEKKNKKLAEDEVKKGVKEFLSKQIMEKNEAYKLIKSQEKKLEEEHHNDYENWKHIQEIKKENLNKKYLELNAARENFQQDKILHEKNELNKMKIKEKEIFDKIEMDNIKEKEKHGKKIQAEKALFIDQIKDLKSKESGKKIRALQEKEEGLKILEEFDKKMEKLDIDRLNYRNAIREKAKIQDVRQKLIVNVKESENHLKRELEQKYLREKNEIEKRNKQIEDYNSIRKKDLIQDIKNTIEEQKKEKRQQEILFMQKNKDFDNKLKNSYNEFLKEQEEKELMRKNKILKYKEELDRQIFEKNERKRKPLMDEIEKQINKSNLT